MLRHSMYAAVVLVVSAAAFAQKSELRRFQRIEGPIKDAGVLHVATGTWTRHNGNASLGHGGSHTIFDCTSASGYYGGIDPGMVWFASGRIPSLTSPNTNWNPIAVPVGSAPGSAQGCQNSYTVDGFQIGYCSDAPGATTTIWLDIYEQYTTAGPVCFNPVQPPLVWPWKKTDLPGDPTPGGNACWIVTIDLNFAVPPELPPFGMLADGDGVYSAGTDDAFCFSFTFPGVTSATAQTGWILAGAPADGTSLSSTPPDHMGIGWKQFPPSTTVEAAGYDGTRFDQAPLTGFPLGGPDVQYGPIDTGIVGAPGTEAGSDMLGDDGFRIEGGTLTPGCYYFGGPGVGPYSNFYLELYANVTCPPPAPGVGYCAGDGLDPNVTVQSCPCANFGTLGRGCASSFNPAGASITASGVVATDGTMPVGSGVVLAADGMNLTAGQMCIFLKGDTDAPGGIAFGDGTRCASGVLIRLRTEPVTPNALPTGGTSTFPIAGDPLSLSVRGATPVGSALTGYYTCYYRNAAAGFCPAPTGGTFNTANGYKIVW